MGKVETGRVFYRDDNGALHFAVSYVDKDGVSSTEDKIIDDTYQS